MRPPRRRASRRLPIPFGPPAPQAHLVNGHPGGALLRLAYAALLVILGGVLLAPIVSILTHRLSPSRTPPSIAQGPRVQILNTADLPEGKHYVNDHALLRLPDGRWILTGIFHPDTVYQGRDERVFVLASAPSAEPS